MTNYDGTSIDIVEFCKRIYQCDQTRIKLLDSMDDEQRGQWSDEHDDKDDILTDIAWYLTRKTGLTLERVLAYIDRAAKGGHFGPWERQGKNKEVWEDITATSTTMADFDRHGGTKDIIAFCWREYPSESKEMLLPKIEKEPEAMQRTDSDADRKLARRRKTIKWLAEAISFIQTRPTLSDREIARMVNVSPSTLCRNEVYKRAANMARAVPPPPNGVKDKDGNIEAVDEDSDNG